MVRNDPTDAEIARHREAEAAIVTAARQLRLDDPSAPDLSVGEADGSPIIFRRLVGFDDVVMLNAGEVICSRYNHRFQVMEVRDFPLQFDTGMIAKPGGHGASSSRSAGYFRLMADLSGWTGIYAHYFCDPLFSLFQARSKKLESLISFNIEDLEHRLLKEMAAGFELPIQHDGPNASLAVNCRMLGVDAKASNVRTQLAFACLEAQFGLRYFDNASGQVTRAADLGEVLNPDPEGAYVRVPI